MALGDDLVRKGPKWHEALGAIDPNERAEALDLLGFEHQVVFSSLCAPLFGITDSALRYAAYRAHNRAMAEFCANDKRLHGVALCDLDEPDRSLAELDFALDLGLGPVWIPARAPGGMSPGTTATTRSGRGLRNAGFRSCCTSAAARCRSTMRGATTVARRRFECRWRRSSTRKT